MKGEQTKNNVPTNNTLNGKDATINVCSSMGIKLEDLIAQTAIFACKKDVGKIVDKYNNALLYLNLRRKTSNEARRTFDGDEFLDDNTYVNRSFKSGFKPTIFEKYTVCHIWDDVHNVNCFSDVRNLVLIPSGIHALSDEIDRIIVVLKYRAFDLYKWWPSEDPCPSGPPPNYPSEENWRPCLCFKNFVQRRFVEEEGKAKLVICEK